ncbi:MAG: FliO/MopB family protein [Bacteriovoracaceae bacterium]|nr:FliO/MopB family protein [Bacteriovoracaceae bacterium]
MRLLVYICSMLLTLSAFAKVKITDIKHGLISNATAKISVLYQGAIEGKPKLLIKNSLNKAGSSIVQVSIPQSVVWPKIEKKITTGGSRFDTTIMAYQYDKQVVRVRALVPFSLKGKEDKVALNYDNGKIEIYIPRGSKSWAQNDGVNRPKASKEKLPQYDESYLNELIKDKKQTKVVEEDEVKRILSANEKDQFGSNQDGGKFSIVNYVMKFAGFLAVVLLLFYGVVNLLKKGVMKRGKLALFDNMEAISVLNTTYIGPKKSLMLIKAHKQVFLVGADDKGMHFLSEISSVAGLLKDGEQSISGTNFEQSLGSAQKQPKDFKLKEHEVELPQESKAEKLSEKIKNKMKNLKPLQ